VVANDGLKVAALSPIEFRNSFIGVGDMATRKVKTEEELAEAMKAGASTIEIEGDLSKTTFKIRATGRVTWALVAASLVAGLVFLKGSSKVDDTKAKLAFAAAGAGTGVGAVAVLGVPASVAAFAIARAYGGIEGLKLLRNYKQVSYQEGKLVLERKA
jgi:hypothetical protein